MAAAPTEAQPVDRPARATVRTWLGRAVLFLAPFLVAGAAAEAWLRPQVGRSGTTPFMTPKREGLPHQLRPGRRTLYKGVEVAINERGFRGASPANPRRARHRIALIGDSIAFGNAIPLEATLAVLLEQHLSAAGESVEVLNFGVPGYNALNVASNLEEVVLEAQPDLVLYVAVTNDGLADRGPVEVPPDARLDEFEAFPLRSAALQWLGVRAKGMLRALGRGTDSGHVAHLVRDFEQHGGRGRTRQAIKRMRAACDAAGAQLLVGMYPYLAGNGRDPLAVITEGIAEHCRRFEVDFLDLRESFQPGENLGRYWANAFDPHPNRDANERVVALLGPHILERWTR